MVSAAPGATRMPTAGSYVRPGDPTAGSGLARGPGASEHAVAGRAARRGDQGAQCRSREAIRPRPPAHILGPGAPQQYHPPHPPQEQQPSRGTRSAAMSDIEHVAGSRGPRLAGQPHRRGRGLPRVRRHRSGHRAVGCVHRPVRGGGAPRRRRPLRRQGRAQRRRPRERRRSATPSRASKGSTSAASTSS